MARRRSKKSRVHRGHGGAGWSRRDVVQTVIGVLGVIGTWWSSVGRWAPNRPSPPASPSESAPVKQIIVRDTLAVGAHETVSLREHVEIKLVRPTSGGV